MRSSNPMSVISLRAKRSTARRKPLHGQTLMDLATLGTKVLKKRGQLPILTESEEINACSVRIRPTIDGEGRTGC